MIDNYQALTLGRYMKVNEVLTGDDEDIDKQVKIIAILSDKTEDEILALPLADYTQLASQTDFLRAYCKPTEIADGWRLEDLVPTSDFRKITTAQYVDFQTFSKDFPASAPELLAVFLVPEGHKYNEGYDFADVVARVKEIPMPDALGLVAFFFARFLKLTEDSLNSWGKDLTMTSDRKTKERIATRIAEVETLLRSVGVGSQT